MPMYTANIMAGGKDIAASNQPPRLREDGFRLSFKPLHRSCASIVMRNERERN